MDRNLIALIKVVETGNLSAAAEQLGLAQPSLSKRLAQLESEYGIKLFERRPHGMTATEFGVELYQHAKRIKQQHLQADEAIAAKISGHLDIVRIGAGPIVRSYFMRPVYNALRHEFPGIRMEFRDDVHTRNLPFLKNGELDVVFGAISHGAEDDDIETLEIAQLTLGMIAHKSHPLASKKKIVASDLLEIPWINYSDGGVAQAMIDGFYVRNGLKTPDFAVKTTSLEFGLELVSSGEFIMPAATQLVDAFEHLGVTVLDLSESIDNFPIGAYVKSSTLKFPAVKRLIQLASNLEKKLGVSH